MALAQITERNAGIRRDLGLMPIVHTRPFERGGANHKDRPEGDNHDPRKDLDGMIERYQLDRETPFRKCKRFVPSERSLASRCAASVKSSI